MYRVRTDMTWDDVVLNFQERGGVQQQQQQLQQQLEGEYLPLSLTMSVFC